MACYQGLTRALDQFLRKSLEHEFEIPNLGSLMFFINKGNGNFPEYQDNIGQYRSISINKGQLSSMLKANLSNRRVQKRNMVQEDDLLEIPDSAPMNISENTISYHVNKGDLRVKSQLKPTTQKKICSNKVYRTKKRKKTIEKKAKSNKKGSIFGSTELQISTLFKLNRQESEDTKPKRKLKEYEQIRHNIAHANKVKADFTKALKMNEDDYLQEFKEKASAITDKMNKINNGDGSSALFNLNMHQDYIISKLGLKKKLTGHDLVIKILLFKILGLTSQNQEESKQKVEQSKPKSAMSVRFARTNYNMPSNRRFLQGNLRSCSQEKRKPGTHQGPRFIHNYTSSGIINNWRTHDKSKKHTSSLDANSTRKVNKDLFSIDGITKDSVEKESPKSTINKIIDQCYQAGDPQLESLDHDFTNNDSLFNLTQNLAEKQHKVFQNIREGTHMKPSGQDDSSKRSIDGLKKKVTFQVDQNEERSPLKGIDNLSILSMSESIESEDSDSSNFVYSNSPIKCENRNRREVRFKRVSRRMNEFYKPALMTKNFEKQLPLFLSEKNMAYLSQLFKTSQHENKYVNNATKTKGFKRKKFINQQKTKTQDRLGELSTQDDIKSFLKKDPSEIFSNALANFWFKDADKFLKQRKSKHIRKESLWDIHEENVYQRMDKDIEKRKNRGKSANS
ncbi:unnamed protein product [Moneuplotes crassus]|uniref:Uncharacterized protein n=2 Tax=Euplotes crassus TaxID=5936 RepID=A0AAD1U2A3_EUPCR|nr:unnamed protein product [Moneuplotes crassus]